MPAWAMRLAWVGEAGDADARHRERDDLLLDRAHHAVGVGLEGRGRQVAVEELVEVLVAGHAHHHLVPGWVADHLAGRPVRDAGRQLLQREVHEPLLEVRRLGDDAARHLRHPAALEMMGIDRPSGHQVAVDRHRVATFLGGPSADPRSPRAVGAEEALDGAEVVRQVVLGEQIDEECRTHGVVDRGPGQVGVGLGPRLTGDRVAAAAVRDVFVGEPLFGGRQVAFQQLFHGGSEVGEQALGGEHQFIIAGLPTSR